MSTHTCFKNPEDAAQCIPKGCKSHPKSTPEAPKANHGAQSRHGRRQRRRTGEPRVPRGSLKMARCSSQTTESRPSGAKGVKMVSQQRPWEKARTDNFAESSQQRPPCRNISICYVFLTCREFPGVHAGARNHLKGHVFGLRAKEWIQKDPRDSPGRPGGGPREPGQGSGEPRSQVYGHAGQVAARRPCSRSHRYM